MMKINRINRKDLLASIEVGDERAATSSHAKIGRNGRDEREEATTRGMKLAAAVHACKIRGNSREPLSPFNRRNRGNHR